MNSKFSIADSALKYILYQRTNTLLFPRFYQAVPRILPFLSYSWFVDLECKFRGRRIKELYQQEIEEEFATFKDSIPRQVNSMLDIGCGLAGMDICINRELRKPGMKFHLLDKTRVEGDVFYRFEEKGAFYNSLDITKDFLIRNGINKENISIYEANAKNEIPIDGNVDLIISIASWGFHYPVDIYLEQAFEILEDGGVLIIDVRNDTDGYNRICSKFGKIKEIYIAKKFRRILAIK